MRKILLVIILIFSSSCVSQNPAIKSNGDSMSTNQTYFIDGKQVAENEFEQFFKKFKRIDKKTISIETPDGGKTSYDVKDSNGLMYEYISESKQGNVFINTLQEKH